MSVRLVEKEPFEQSYYYNKRGEVPFWDHPLITGYKILPKNYYPYVTLEAVLSLYQRGRIDDSDIMLLKVLGDAICCNEDQLRRYLSGKLSRSDVSKRLNKFREVGLVDRWKVRIRTDENEEIKPPAPFVLGVAGFKLLKHYYNDQFFMDPNRWDTLGVGAVQRYVAVNELRARLIEVRAARNWFWNPIVANNKSIKKPMSVTEIKTFKGNINFFIERAQMSQDFIGFIRSKLNNWVKVYEKYGNFPINHLAANVPIIILYTSTLTMAQTLHKELMVDTYPFTVWFCVEEDMIEDGLDTAFYRPVKEKLQRMRLDFLI